MANILVPELGESITEATVGQWLKSAEGFVEAGEAVVELETDKVNLEVIAETSGVLSQTVPTGQTVRVGEILAVLLEKRVGTPMEGVKERLATSQVLLKPLPVSTLVASEQENAADSPLSTVVNDDLREHSVSVKAANRLPPSRRRLALNTDTLRRSEGEGGRLIFHSSPKTPTDKKGELSEGLPSGMGSEGQNAHMIVPPELASGMAALNRDQTGYKEERVPMTRRRRTLASRLVQTQHTAAMLTTFNEVDMSAILDVRKRRRDGFKEKHGVNLGFMSFFTKAVVAALKEYPRLNAEIVQDTFVLKYHYDMGIAVATDAGLVVPVVRDADALSFAEIERQIANLAIKARAGTLSLAELQGGTFTLTNGGVFGSLLSTPILNGPQVGILGMHTIQERPVAVRGQVEIRPMMYVALSYDHRIVDGSESVRFLISVKKLLEDPESLLLEG